MLKKVSPNDPLSIPASTYNAFIDATRDFQKNKGFKNKPNNHSTPYYVQNKTGKRLPIYSVVMITGLVIDSPDSADETENLNWLIGLTIVFKGEIPDKNSNYFTKIAITTQPLEIDGVGTCVLDGLVKCKITQEETTELTNNLPFFLSPKDQNTDSLFIANYGTIECFFTQTPKKQETVYGVANLGGAVVPSYFLVDLVWKSGGDSDTSYEARIYDIKLNGNTLKTDVDIATGNHPYRRPQDYNITKADIAMAFVGGKGEILIAWANEYPLLGVAEVMP